MSGEKLFLFNGYDFLVSYANTFIEDLEDHFEKSKKKGYNALEVTRLRS